jgi:Tfp pilus assembly protein FimT
MVIAALSIPNMVTALNNYRLDTSGRATASLLTQARLQAVRNNFAAYAQYDTSKTPNIVYINNDPAAAYAVGIPDVEIASASFQTSSLPDHTQLDALLANGNTGVTAEIGTVVGFNARGLPCMESGGNPVVCPQQDPLTSNIPYFEWFMQGTAGGWEAVTVSPAGRIKAWRMTFSTDCGYPACWE